VQVADGVLRKENQAMPTWDNLTNTTFDEIQPGAEASLTRTLSPTDIEVLVLVSGDVAPFHVAGNGAASVRTDASTTEAAGAEALVAAVLGTRLPGPGIRIVREDLRFQGRIAVGDNLTAAVKAQEKLAEGSEVSFACRCVNEAGFDNAISTEAAESKKIVSPVAGQADILLVPDLEAGNMLAKQLAYLSGAEGAGIVLGARVPIVLTSRADSVRTRLASTAVMAPGGARPARRHVPGEVTPWPTHLRS
jgi:acyl dehydratase